jgi:hypothetical protein
MTKIRTAICAAITKGERDKDAPSRAGQVNNLPPTGSGYSTNLFRFGIEPAGNRLPPTATPARKVGAAQVTPVIGSMMQPYRRRGVHEDLTGETLALPVFDIQLPEGRGLLRKRDSNVFQNQFVQTPRSTCCRPRHRNARHLARCAGCQRRNRRQAASSSSSRSRCLRDPSMAWGCAVRNATLWAGVRLPVPRSCGRDQGTGLYIRAGRRDSG